MDDFTEQTAPDSYVEETTTGWGNRIVNSLAGVLAGIILVIGAGILLFWNEGRTVKTTLAINEAAKSVVSVDSNAIDQANNNKLVHVTGDMATSETLKDPDFAISVNAVGLTRIVEIYQWRENQKKETKKNIGGSQTEYTTYTYEKVWSKDPVNSSSFKKPEGHTNASQVLYTGRNVWANQVNLGKFILSKSLVSQMNNFEALPFDTDFKQKLPSPIQSKAQIAGEWCYLGDPQNPQVGDEKIEFKIIRPGPVSIISRQYGNTFTPYVAQSGKSIDMIKPGILGSDLMLGEARQENDLIAWVLRGVGILFIFVGICLILKPISVVLDFLPILGSIAGVEIAITALGVSLVLSATIIGVAWMSYRPVFSVEIIVTAVAVALLLRSTKKNRMGPGTA